MRRLRRIELVDLQIARLKNLGPHDLNTSWQGVDIALFCPAYPGGHRAYGGEFVQTRAEAYIRAGLTVCVFEVDTQRQITKIEQINGVDVIRCNLQTATNYLRTQNPKHIAAHLVEKPVWATLKPWAGHTCITVWIHGVEARHWRALEHCYSSEDLKSLRPLLDRQSETRKNTMKEILEDHRVKKFIVSNFMKNVVQDFTGAYMRDVEVIHNPILRCDFPYVEKTKNDRFNILWVRSFSSRNYANDLSRDVILRLSETERFSEMKITIQGDGVLFDETVSPLEKFPNVDIRKGFVSTSNLRDMHASHGILLVPCRWDSQGLTCGEGMASGLVPITTDVAAMPEFVDSKCGYLCPKDDAEAMAAAIMTLVNNPEIFLEKSRLSAERSAKQCGEHATLAREIQRLKTVTL